MPKFTKTSNSQQQQDERKRYNQGAYDDRPVKGASEAAEAPVVSSSSVSTTKKPIDSTRAYSRSNNNYSAKSYTANSRDDAYYKRSRHRTYSRSRSRSKERDVSGRGARYSHARSSNHYNSSRSKYSSRRHRSRSGSRTSKSLKKHRQANYIVI